MKKLILTGRLAKQFGAEFNLHVTSPAEAIRALCYQIPGFEDALKEGSYRVTRMTSKDTGFDIGVDALHLNFGKSEGFTLAPIVRGSKKGGLGKIILGIALVAAAFFFAPVAMAATATTAASGGMASMVTIAGMSTGISYGYLATTGAMMMLNGISKMLTPTPKNSGPSDQNESFMMDGTGNLTQQGNPVPIVVGLCYTGSVVISTGVNTEEMTFMTMVRDMIS